jgi:hypothetical protein
MRWILNLDILLLVSGIARKHGIVPKPFLGHPQYSPPPKKKHFLPRTRDFSRKRVCGFSNRRLQEMFLIVQTYLGGQSLCSPHLTPQIQCLPGPQAHVNHLEISNWYFPVGIGKYFLVFTIPILKEISVGIFWYHFFGGNPFFP